MKKKFPDNIELLINKLHLKKVHLKGDELWCLCPKHNDKNPDNFSIQLTSGKCFCFSCLWGGNIINLLFEHDLSYTESFGIWNSIKLEAKSEINPIAEPINKKLEEYYMNNGVSPYALERVESYDILKLYHIYSDNKGNPIFIINDFTNIPRSIWVDDLEIRKQKKHSFFLLEPLTAKTDGWVFGQHLRPRNKTIIVEGFYDAPNVYEKLEIIRPGEFNVVSIMGVHITPAQKNTLLRMSNLYFMPDGDKAGRMARDKWHEQFDGISKVRFCGKYRNDPDELTGEQLIEILDNSKSWLDYFIEIKK